MGSHADYINKLRDLGLSYLTSLCLNFLNYRMNIIIVLKS